MQFQPLIRYVGGKRKQSEDIISMMPTEFDTFYIPFLGSGAVMFQLLNSNIKFNKIVASDIYRPLMEIWTLVKENPERLMSLYDEMYNNIVNNGKDYYDEVVKNFNDSQDDMQGDVLGATFFFITRACVRGNLDYDIYGNFITKCQKLGVGDRNAITSPETLSPIVNRWHQAIQDVEFRCEDYEFTIRDAQAGDFVFLDPPYIDGTWYHDHNMCWDSFFSIIENLPCDWGMTLNGDKDIYAIPESTGYTDHKYIYYGIKKSQSGRPIGSRDSYWMKKTDEYEYDDTRKKNVRQNERGQGGMIPQINDIKMFNDIEMKMAELERKVDHLTMICNKILQLQNPLAYDEFIEEHKEV